MSAGQTSPKMLMVAYLSAESYLGDECFYQTTAHHQSAMSSSVEKIHLVTLHCLCYSNERKAGKVTVRTAVILKSMPSF